MARGSPAAGADDLTLAIPDPAADPSQERLAARAEELRASGRIGRSDLFNRLFDFLLAQSLAGRSPKEVEVAHEVFGKDGGFDVGQDASVRVHIHRLRRRLEEIQASQEGDRLIIPRGEYRLALEAPEAEAQPDAPEPAEATDALAPLPPRAAPSRWQLIAALLIALAIGAGIGAWVTARHEATPGIAALARAPMWQALAENRRPTFVVTGDYYIFGEAQSTAGVNRLVREFSINSRQDLDDYLMAHPDDYGRYVDLDLHYLPISTAYALRDVIPAVDGLTRRAGAARPFVITMSRLTAEAMKGSNIIYVGFLSSLGLLRDPVFQASGFQVGESYDELIDKATSKHFMSDWDEVTDNRTPKRDYAYLATFPGPSGNRIIIVGGTRDAAVTQAGEVAADPAQLAQIAAKSGGAENFEALYEVRTLGALNLGSTLVMARPLKLKGLWQPDQAPGRFPDQLAR